MSFISMTASFPTALALLFLPSGASGIAIAVTEDFSGGIGGWQEGGPSPNPPSIITGGGPDGTDYLQNISEGGGAGSRLAMFNTTSMWIGNYLGINATFVSLSAKNSSVSALISLRVAFNGPGGWFASEAFSLAADDTWQDVLFDLSEPSMTYVSGGTGVYSDTKSDVTNFEIFSAASTLQVGGGGSGIVRGDVMTATLGIDNIAVIPEVSTSAFLALFALGALRRRRSVPEFTQAPRSNPPSRW